MTIPRRLVDKRELAVREERETTVAAIREEQEAGDDLRAFRALLRNPEMRPVRLPKVDTVDTEPE